MGGKVLKAVKRKKSSREVSGVCFQGPWESVELHPRLEHRGRARLVTAGLFLPLTSSRTFTPRDLSFSSTKR